MATASNYFNKGSDEIRSQDCGVCLSNGSTVEAISYCIECCEYMCRSCDMAHGTFKATKYHNISTGIDMPPRRSKPTLPFMFCDTHKTSLLNSYCTAHDEVICQACKMNSHINCDTGDVRGHSGQSDVEKELKKIVKSLKVLTTRYEDFTKNRDIDKSTVKTQIQKCLSDMRQFRKDINDELDKEEKKLSSEMRFIEETMTKEIDVGVILADGILCQLGDLDKSLSECQKTLENDVKFVGMKRAASWAKEYGEILSNVQKDIYPIDISFQPNDALTGIIQQAHDLGTVTLRNRPAIKIPEDLDLPIGNANDFPIVIHGTYYEAWESIKTKGLNRMNRNHIKFAPGEPGQGSVISGMRPICQVMIYLDLEKALKDGMKFYISSNNVILSPGDENGCILPRYFLEAKDRRNGYSLGFDAYINPGDSNKRDGNRKQRKIGGQNNKETGIDLSQLKSDYGDEDLEDSSEPDMKILEISDNYKSKCTIDAIMKEQPPFVVVTCCGQNLGEEKSCINQLRVGTGNRLFIFNLENKTLMEDGHLRNLLMDTNITKVFFRIDEVSLSLINEYGILLNGVPLHDIEILYDKLSGQLAAREREIIKEMGFHRKMFKKWSKKCQTFSSELEDPEELKQQARMIYKMFPLFEKGMSEVIIKILKKQTFEKAMLVGENHFLAEKIKKMKLEQKNEKKRKAENN